MKRLILIVFLISTSLFSQVKDIEIENFINQVGSIRIKADLASKDESKKYLLLKYMTQKQTNNKIIKGEHGFLNLFICDTSLIIDGFIDENLELQNCQSVFFNKYFSLTDLLQYKESAKSLLSLTTYFKFAFSFTIGVYTGDFYSKLIYNLAMSSTSALSTDILLNQLEGNAQSDLPIAQIDFSGKSYRAIVQKTRFLEKTFLYPYLFTVLINNAPNNWYLDIIEGFKLTLGLGALNQDVFWANDSKNYCQNCFIKCSPPKSGLVIGLGGNGVAYSKSLRNDSTDDFENCLAYETVFGVNSNGEFIELSSKDIKRKF